MGSKLGEWVGCWVGVAIATFVSCRGRCRMYGEVMCISLYNIPRFLFSVYDWLTP
jgi:hypothetical protein